MPKTSLASFQSDSISFPSPSQGQLLHLSPPLSYTHRQPSKSAGQEEAFELRRKRTWLLRLVMIPRDNP